MEFILNIMVVDSDDITRTHIQSLISKSDKKIEVLQFCTNGYEAMKAIKALKPDVVFTEIEQANIDGISLIKEAYEQGLTCDFIIYSTTASFEAAQKAMRYGVQEYLIKPLSESDFNRVTEKYLSRKYTYLESDIINHRLLKTRRALQDSFMADFTAFPKQLKVYNITELNQKYHFRFQEGIFQIVSVLLDQLPDDVDRFFLPRLAESIWNKYEPLCCELVPYVQENKRLTLLFNYSEKADILADPNELVDIIKKHLNQWGFPQISYCVGIGTPEKYISDLSIALESSEKAARCGTLRGRNQVYRYGELLFNEIQSIDILTPELLNEMYKTAAILDIDGFARVIRNAFSPVSPYCDSAIVIDITHAVIDTIVNTGINEGFGKITDSDISYVHHRLGDAMTIGDTVSVLINWARKQFYTFRQNIESDGGNNNRLIRMAKKYINDNYMYPITLNSVAHHIHLNASYFSIIFKKETGQNFSVYLRNYRIETAKKLLRESNLSITDISNAVGYKDRKYFSQIFTQVVGLKPSEYRSQR